MIQITPQMRILLAIEPVDFRNHSERPIIPSTLRGSLDWRSVLPFWTLCDSE